MARPITHDATLRERLLDETATLVDRKGPAGVSLREIAQAAGTSTSAVYALFGGKAQLLVAVIESGFRRFGEAQSAAEPQGLRALGVAYREWATANAPMYRLMFGGATIGIADCSPEAATARSALLPLVRTLASRHTPIKPELAAVAVWAQVHGAVSLELASVAPVEVDWNAAYEVVLDTIESFYPAT